MSQPTTPAPDRFVSPCPPPTAAQREVVEILAEEGAEVIQRATKLLRFGVEEVQPGQPFTNAQRLSHEVGDLLETIRLAERDGLIDPAAVAFGQDRKRRQLARFLQRAAPPLPPEESTATSADAPARQERGELARGIERALDRLLGFNGGQEVSARNIAYTAWNKQFEKNPDDGGRCDWFTDTLPMVKAGLAEIRARFLADVEAASPITVQRRRAEAAEKALATARAHLQARRDEDFRSFTLNGDPASMDEAEAAFIAGDDAVLAEIEAVLGPAPTGGPAAAVLPTPHTEEAGDVRD